MDLSWIRRTLMISGSINLILILSSSERGSWSKTVIEIWMKTEELEQNNRWHVSSSLNYLIRFQILDESHVGRQLVLSFWQK